MTRAAATIDIAAGPAHVWSVLIDWEGQARWMADAQWVRVLTPQRQGPGVIIRARTDIVARLRVDDDMIVTQWCELERIGVRHLGRIIRGSGAFELQPSGAGTRFTWWEELELPLGPVGAAAGRLLIAPYVSRIFRRSLAQLKQVAEAR
ncbi:MAG TPA: SRPBCC family protein [Egibacteraceae bacterium]|nr:SRPBCC family protein [Egibacteraceae bacterium]